MHNWGDQDAAQRLATQLRDLLRDRTMTFDQLASCYSIKHGQSVTQRLKELSQDSRLMTLSEFAALMDDKLEATGKNQVRAKKVAENDKAELVGSDNSPAATNTPSAQTPMKYADVSRSIQNILKEYSEPLSVEQLDKNFKQKFETSIEDIVGMPTGDYLQRKENIFDYSTTRGTVFLQSSMLAGPPMADPEVVKDEMFVVKEFEQLIEAMGPVVYISTLCGKFIQRNGISVTSIISTRPLDLFKRHPNVFLIVGAGNVTLKKYETLNEVQRLLDKPSSKAQRIAKAAEEAQLPIPELVTEEHVVDEFRRLILADGTDSVYISSLCGRFLQRFKKPVTGIISCKPAEFLRRYPDVFVMTGGGNVGLREVLGPDAVSVPPPPPRVPKSLREDNLLAKEQLQAIELTDEVFAELHKRFAQEDVFRAMVKQLTTVCAQIQQSSFLAIEDVVLGGAAGKGLMSTGPQAEIVLFVRQLPFRNFPQWLPHILDTLAPVLEYQLSGHNVDKFKVEKDRLRFRLGSAAEKDVFVHVYLSPVFRGRDHLIECIAAAPPAERFYFYPAFVKERNAFIARQPQEVKHLMRLMTWWASKQCWSSPFAAPSDWLMELVVINECQQLEQAGTSTSDGNFSLADMTSRVLGSLTNFSSMKVLWADAGLASYATQGIWRPLLAQEPLFMDPLNPYCNLADPSSFDARELAVAAQPLDCFNCFKREAAHFVLAQEKNDDAADDLAEDGEVHA